MSLFRFCSVLAGIVVLLAAPQVGFAREIEAGDYVILQSGAKPLPDGLLPEYVTIIPVGLIQEVTPEYVVIQGVRFAKSDVVQLDEALEHFNAKLAADPQSVDALIGRSVYYHDQEEDDKALADCETAIKLAPKQVRLYQIQSLLFSNKKDFEKAVTATEQAFALEPQDPRNYYCRGYLELQRDDYPKALEAFDKSLELSPDYIFASMKRVQIFGYQEKYDEAVQECTTVIRKDYNNAIAYLYRAVTLRQSGDTESALRDALEAVRLEPKSANALAFLGMAQQSEYNRTEAFEAFNKAIEMARTPGDKEYCYTARGAANVERLALKEAQADLEQALAAGPDAVTAVTELGKLYLAQDSPQGALDAYGRFLAQNPKSKSVLSLRARLLHQQKQIAPAIADLDAVLALDPKNLFGLVLRGTCYLAQQELVKSAQDLDAALAVDALDSDALCHRGLVHLEAKEFDKAIELFTKSIEVNPYNTLARRGKADTWKAKGNTVTEAFDRVELTAIAMLYHEILISTAENRQQIGFYNSAIETCREILEFDPDYYKAYLCMAKAKLGAEQWALAEPNLNKVIELTPRNAQAFLLRAFARMKSNQESAKVTEDLVAAIKFGGELRGQLLLVRAKYYESQEDYGHMLEDIRAARKLNPNSSHILNNLAWMLATCPDEKHRNGKEAIAFATKACEITDWEEWHIIDTLAAAYAEAGEMEQALEFHKQGMELGSEELEGTEAEERLALYEAGKPYHQSPLKRDANGKPIIAPEDEITLSDILRLYNEDILFDE